MLDKDLMNTISSVHIEVLHLKKLHKNNLFGPFHNHISCLYSILMLLLHYGQVSTCEVHNDVQPKFSDKQIYKVNTFIT